MSDELIKKEDLFNVIKHGHEWYNEKIKEALEEIIENKYVLLKIIFLFSLAHFRT
jgi:hypothetical protein